MRTGFLGILFLALLVLGGAAATALGSDLYAMNASGAPTTGTLHKIDQSAGSSTLVGPTGGGFVGDLTSDTRPGSFRMWGPDMTTSTLVEIDPATGVGTPVSGFTSPTTIVSLAFDITTGALYGTTAQGFGAPQDQLYLIDPNTAACTLIGSLGINNAYALAFDNAGTLYAVGQDRQALFTVSTTTGAASLVAEIGLSSVFDIATRPEDNTTFAVDTATSGLYTLDLSNGATALVGNYSATNLVGLAFTPIPEPGTLILLIGGIAAPTLFRRRRPV